MTVKITTNLRHFTHLLYFIILFTLFSMKVINNQNCNILFKLQTINICHGVLFPARVAVNASSIIGGQQPLWS